MAFGVTRNAAAIASGRLSYIFNWSLECMVINTACSSSLVALSMGARRSDHFSFCAGVNAMFDGRIFDNLARVGMLSVDGRCKAFDSSANGYVRGEGVGALLLGHAVESLPRYSSFFFFPFFLNIEPSPKSGWSCC